MLRCVVALMVIAGCEGKGDKKPAATCADEVARLTSWIEVLVSEGHATLQPQRDVDPVVVRDVAPASIEPLPVVIVTRGEVTYQGQLIATHKGMIEEAASFAEKLRVARDAPGMGPDPELGVFADRSAPWSSIASVGEAASNAGFARLRFVFRGVTKLTDPPPSWLDAEHGPLRDVDDPNAPVPDLAAAERRANDPKRRRVFDRCPSGRALFEGLDARAGETGDRGALIAAGIPNAYKECGCAEDVAAVQRLMWDLWSRGQSNMPHASVVATIAATAPRLSIAPTMAWADAHSKVVDRVKRGEPISFGP